MFEWVKKRRKSINERGHLTAGADTKNQRSIKDLVLNLMIQMIPPIQMNQGHLNDMKDIGQGHPEEEKIGQGHPEEEKIGQGHPGEEKIGQGHPEDEKINLNLIRADVMVHTIALIQKVLIKTDLKKEKKGNIRIWN